MTLYYYINEADRKFGRDKVRTWLDEAIDIMPRDTKLDMCGWIERYFQVKFEEERKSREQPNLFNLRGTSNINFSI